jgi:hypothetical protein
MRPASAGDPRPRSPAGRAPQRPQASGARAAPRGGPQHQRAVDHNRRTSGRLRQRRPGGPRPPRPRRPAEPKRGAAHARDPEHRVLARHQAGGARVRQRRPARGLHRGRGDRRRALLRAVHRHGVQPAAVDRAIAEPLGRHPLGQERGPGQPPLPPAPGLRLHDLRQVGVPGARLDGDERRLRLRDAGRGPHARRLRARRADEGPLQRDRPAHLARRQRRARRPLRCLQLHRALPRALRQGRHRGRLRGHALSGRRAAG